jgi:hypothetical protein
MMEERHINYETMPLPTSYRYPTATPAWAYERKIQYYERSST